MAHPNARDRTLVALAVQRGVLSPTKVPRVLALCERLTHPAEEVLPRWVEDAIDLVKQGGGYRYRCGCRLWKLAELSEEPELRCSQCQRPFVAEASPDPLEESSVRGRPIPELLEETIREPGRFAPTAAEQPTTPAKLEQPGFVSTRRDPYRGNRDSPIPERIGPFEVEHQLGTGATGSVYLAKHPRGRPVAVKLLHASVDAEALLRFQREVHLGRQLRHPGIVEVLDTGQTKDGKHFLVMDYVPGLTLRAKLETGPLDPPEALRIVRQAAEAVAFLHEQGLIHRDLKPENLILDPARGRVRITDLGLARPVKDLSITDTGTVVGTPHYMAPEQLAGDKELDAATDVYALGVILYECLTGHTLHPDLTALALAARIFDEPPPKPQRAGVELPGPLVGECTRALDPDPLRRHANGGELAYALACLRSLEPGARPGWRPHPAWVVGVSLVLLAIVIALLPSGEAPPTSPTVASPPPASPDAASPTPPSPSPSPGPADRVALAGARTRLLQYFNANQQDPPQVWDDLVERFPQDARPRHARAACYLLGGDPLRAYEDLALTYRLDPLPPPDFLDFCVSAFHALGYERAAIDWQLRREPTPFNTVLLATFLAQSRMPVQDLERSRALLEQPFEEQSTERVRRRALAMTLFRLGAHEEALRLAQSAGLPTHHWTRAHPPYLAPLPRPPKLVELLTAARVDETLTPQRLAEFASAAPHRGEQAAIWIHVARDTEQRGRFDDALDQLRRALNLLEPSGEFPALEALARRLYARVLMLAKARGQAIEQGTRVLDGDPDVLTVGERCDTLTLLAATRLELNQFDEARALLERAHLAGPEDRRVLDLLQRKLPR